MTCVDGFVIPVPKSKVAAYKKMAALGKKVWMKYGALQYFECVGDDLAGMPKSIPFDMKRMTYGGSKTLVQG